jgi:hypothetical protein
MPGLEGHMQLSSQSMREIEHSAGFGFDKSCGFVPSEVGLLSGALASEYQRAFPKEGPFGFSG